MSRVKTFYTIYQITNNINGKIYIGKHQTQDLEDTYLGSGKLISKAVKKYGKENFTKEVLLICLSKEDLNLYEKLLIKEKNSCILDEKHTGYNMTRGGDGNTSETAKLYVEKQILENRNAFVGSKGSLLQKERIKNGTHNFNKETSSKGGKKGILHVKENGWSAEAIKKRVETRKAKDNYSRNMGAANTEEAIKKRIQTRRENGSLKTSPAMYSKEAMIKKAKTKYLKIISNIMSLYNTKEFSYDLLEIALKDRKTYIQKKVLAKYFTEQELKNIFASHYISDS